ncbi:MAG: 50S ribosomal protein L11 methyltransferase [Chitinophagaceae bacterium]
MQYIQLEFISISPDRSDMLIAELSEIGFDGFEESGDSLKAFIPEKDFDESLLKQIAAKQEVSFEKTIIKETNWNAAWESSFQPVIMDDFVAIRAAFHKPVTGVEQEIIITPKMSFGTGHHATTLMMLRQMREIDFTGKTVLDFGTGTGILAILAERLGAAKITAIDYDEWSISNAKENVERNQCRHIFLEKADRPRGGDYDIILANINKQVIFDNLYLLARQLNKTGILLISGLLAVDETDLLTETGKYSLILSEKIRENNWIALRFSH